MSTEDNVMPGPFPRNNARQGGLETMNHSMLIEDSSLPAPLKVRGVHLGRLDSKMPLPAGLETRSAEQMHGRDATAGKGVKSSGSSSSSEAGGKK